MKKIKQWLWIKFKKAVMRAFRESLIEQFKSLGDALDPYFNSEKTEENSLSKPEQRN